MKNYKQPEERRAMCDENGRYYGYVVIKWSNTLILRVRDDLDGRLVKPEYVMEGPSNDYLCEMKGFELHDEMVRMIRKETGLDKASVNIDTYREW